jgi:hypothetical protein
MIFVLNTSVIYMCWKKWEYHLVMLALFGFKQVCSLDKALFIQTISYGFGQHAIWWFGFGFAYSV